MTGIRPLVADDAPAAAGLMHDAFAAAAAAAGQEPRARDDERRERATGRIRRFTDTDPSGCWAVDDEDGLAGFAVALRRGPLWGLALLFVRRDRQSGGLGRRLLERARASADGARVEMIMASQDPRAIRRYATLGLTLHPAMKASGRVERAALPSGLVARERDAGHAELVDQVDVPLRGSSRAADVAALLAEDKPRMLVIDDGEQRGYAVHVDGNVVCLGATDAATARDLLWSALAHADDGEVEHYGWTAAQSWAIDVAVQARLSVEPGGPMFIRGLPAPPGPWLPSGVYF